MSELQLDKKLCQENCTEDGVQAEIIGALKTDFDRTYAATVTAKNLSDTKLEECSTYWTHLHDNSSTANTNQEHLEKTNCEVSLKVAEARNTFHSSWKSRHELHQANTEMVFNQSIDRNSEFRTIKIIECLLDRVLDLNYRPCDTAEGVEGNVTFCENNWTNIEVTLCTTHSHLCITYDDPPAMPSMPLEPDATCSAEWDADIMQVLPVVPVAEFNASNPGCNSYPACQICTDFGITIPPLVPTNYHKWTNPYDSDFAGNHTEASATATAANYTGAPGGVNYD